MAKVFIEISFYRDLELPTMIEVKRPESSIKRPIRADWPCKFVGLLELSLLFYILLVLVRCDLRRDGL